MKTYQCRIRIFYTGKHLDKHLNKHLPNCNESVTLEMLTKMEEEEVGSCSKSVPCDHTDYFIDGAKSHAKDLDNQQTSIFRLVYNVPFTEYYRSSVAVDEQKLIGQLGGKIGITLGWSWIRNMDLIELISGFISYVMLQI